MGKPQTKNSIKEGRPPESEAEIALSKKVGGKKVHKKKKKKKKTPIRERHGDGGRCKEKDKGRGGRRNSGEGSKWGAFPGDFVAGG